MARYFNTIGICRPEDLLWGELWDGFTVAHLRDDGAGGVEAWPAAVGYRWFGFEALQRL